MFTKKLPFVPFVIGIVLIVGNLFTAPLSGEAALGSLWFVDFTNAYYPVYFGGILVIVGLLMFVPRFLVERKELKRMH